MSEDTPTKQRTPGTTGSVLSPHSGTSKVPHITQDGASASQPRGYLTISRLLFLTCTFVALIAVISATLPVRTDDNERLHHATLQENITFMQLARRRNDNLQWATLISNFSAEKCASLCNTGYADCVESTHVTCPSEYCLLWRSLNYEMAKELGLYDGVFVPVRYEPNTYPSASGSPEWSDPSVKEFMCPQRLEAPAPTQSTVTTTVAASTITEFSSSTTTVYETVTPALESRQSPSSDIGVDSDNALTKEQAEDAYAFKVFTFCFWIVIGIALVAYFMFRIGDGTNIQAPTHEERDELPLVRRVGDVMQLGRFVDIQITSELCKYMCSMWTSGCVGSTYIRSPFKGTEDQDFCVLWTRLSDNPPFLFDGIGSLAADLASADIAQQGEYAVTEGESSSKQGSDRYKAKGFADWWWSYDNIKGGVQSSIRDRISRPES
ncbi:hypothetical protein LTR97_012644 [Elasticomyces elasticus]|uniref:Uncharacterized protein n=1 Tax=Elasticomyces elasticus TaxID=574655 RepID=A0AAN7ZQD3_9PEZI|nr:hypothetical protein LTR97_012644 [Elasticomyces elasticus]